MAKEEKPKWEMAKWEKAKREYTVQDGNLWKGQFSPEHLFTIYMYTSRSKVSLGDFDVLV
jgi:hypothetical protein